MVAQWHVHVSYASKDSRIRTAHKRLRRRRVLGLFEAFNIMNTKHSDPAFGEAGITWRNVTYGNFVYSCLLQNLLQSSSFYYSY